MKDEKRMAGDYKIIQAIVIGDKEIVIGENQADTNGQKYMTAVGEWNDLFEFYDQVLVSDDYPEIVGYFGQRVAEQAKKTRDELFRPSFQGIENTPITADDCTITQITNVKSTIRSVGSMSFSQRCQTPEPGFSMLR